MVDNTWRSRIESLLQFQWKWCSQTQCISPFLLHLLGLLLVLCTSTQNPLEEWRRDNDWSNILKKCHSQSLIRALYLITVRAYHADILINKQESDAMCKRHLPLRTRLKLLGQVHNNYSYSVTMYSIKIKIFNSSRVYRTRLLCNWWQVKYIRHIQLKKIIQSTASHSAL